ncbi:ATP-binding cassette domain-containing protein [Actinobacteria bacterium YIM 96077]|uniref:ABC transporter ATP-binding protein n=1 Tax=Phytoactinopolyspora halophila TaxID=1981511 RepID=A0A329QJ40_9ACTN|nr:ATP-binding cassette domain-containing protein [Actinobacteria bacterium YIM 96077]RAW12385.1 ABC transporter ATP-binding protein [Phytoactinopolyspora halophila]
MIEVRALTKRYGDVQAVTDLSFTVKPGIVTGFLGPNGAGKTTTMRMILGLDRPTSGDVTVGGRRYAELGAPLREVGALLDAKAMHGRRKALNHLLCLAQSNGIGRDRVKEVLHLVGLDTVGDKHAGTFSLGMAQRLGIAAALLGDPPVLMFDEPVNGLDPEGIRWIRTLMRDLAAEGRTVLVSSHLLSEMAQTADHLLVIGRGELVADMPTADVLGNAEARAVLVRVAESPDESFLQRLTEAGAEVTEREDDALLVSGLDSAHIGGLATGSGAVLSELTPQRVSLEEAFMELTEEYVEYHGGEGQAQR